MTHSELILHYDKQQADPATARLCPEHGTKLAVHGTGQGLVCGVIIERTGLAKFKMCEYKEPIGAY